SDSGELEHLLLKCRSAENSHTELMQVAESAVSDANEIHGKETWTKEAKARLLTFLGIQAEPTGRYGTAFQKKYLNTEAEALQPFKTWLLTALDLPVAQAEVQT